MDRRKTECGRKKSERKERENEEGKEKFEKKNLEGD